jgi:ribonuclease Z
LTDQFAAIAGAKQLIIGHFSARYKDPKPLQEEAKLYFDNTLLAEEGKTYLIENTDIEINDIE